MFMSLCYSMIDGMALGFYLTVTNKVNTNIIFGKGEVFILNTYTDNGVEFLTKNSPNHWRKICSDSKSQPRYDYSFFDLSLLQELQLVKPDNQDSMDYEVYKSAFK